MKFMKPLKSFLKLIYSEISCNSIKFETFQVGEMSFLPEKRGKRERENSIGMIHRRGNIKEAGSAFLADGGMRYLCQQQDTHRERGASSKMVTGGQGPGSPLLLMAAKSHRCVRVSLREPRLSGPNTDLKKLFKRPEKRRGPGQRTIRSKNLLSVGIVSLNAAEKLRSRN
jgi:hypothetical protein